MLALIYSGSCHTQVLIDLLLPSTTCCLMTRSDPPTQLPNTSQRQPDNGAEQPGTSTVPPGSVPVLVGRLINSVCDTEQLFLLLGTVGWFTAGISSCLYCTFQQPTKSQCSPPPSSAPLIILARERPSCPLKVTPGTPARSGAMFINLPNWRPRPDVCAAPRLPPSGQCPSYQSPVSSCPETSASCGRQGVCQVWERRDHLCWPRSVSRQDRYRSVLNRDSAALLCSVRWQIFNVESPLSNTSTVNKKLDLLDSRLVELMNISSQLHSRTSYRTGLTTSSHN